MDLIRLAIARPTAVIAAVMMVVMFGWVALQTIPIQLIPDVNRPVITVTTNWRGASPAEVEREIVNRQEEALRGLEGLTDMTSSSDDGRALSDAGVQSGLQHGQVVAAGLKPPRPSWRISRLKRTNRPSRLPGQKTNAIAWFILKRAKGNAGTAPIHTFGDLAKDVIQDRLERVPGVGGVNVYGGADREIEVTVDPNKPRTLPTDG